jgi:trehalose 6-phosphate synthase/phosphatase
VNKTNQPQEGRVVIVSNRLPVSIERHGDHFETSPSVGGLATSLEALRENSEMLWLGWPGINPEDEKTKAAIEKKLLADYNNVPIFPPSQLFDRYYHGFSNGTLWPLFHYFSQFAHYKPEEWSAYRDVNRMFCDKIVEVSQPGDRIWIQDYQLMLVPAMVRSLLPEAQIGFFLHIPFPSYEIFRILPWRVEILEGLLGADLIGFHSYSYARHFQSSLLRLMGLEQEFGRVSYGDRYLQIDTFPLGVNVDRFIDAGETETAQEELAELVKNTEGRKVVLSVDRLDFTKGILERLQAFENFLERHKEWLGKVTMIALCVPSRTSVPEYQNLKRQVDEAVGRINGRFGQPGWTPIWYLYRSLPFERLISLYRLADVALVTPLRDGMNLVAKEYLASRPDGTGVLVLSETAGAAEELGEAILVNPHDEFEMVRALYDALNMTEDEQKSRNRPMLARLRRYNTVRWGDDFISQMDAAVSNRSDRPQRLLSGRAKDELVLDYQETQRRLLLLDYDGTLVRFYPRPEDARPDDGLLELLKTFVADPKNEVVIISGRDSTTLENWLAETGVDMAAEHGMKYRLASEGEWKDVDELVSDEWKEKLRPVLEVYVDRTPGSALEEKGAALVWHYRRAEPEMGSVRAKQLMDTLEGFVSNTSLHVLQGNKVVEVKQSTINKGTAVQRWLFPETPHDFVLAIGDDTTDEDLFAALDESCWTVKVGYLASSHARSYVPEPKDVRQLLKALSETS